MARQAPTRPRLKCVLLLLPVLSLLLFSSRSAAGHIYTWAKSFGGRYNDVAWTTLWTADGD